MLLPNGDKDLINKSLDLIGICNSDQSNRMARYRNLSDWVDAGKDDGGRAIVNKLYGHIDRLQSHLFSPTDLRFNIDFENHYSTPDLKQAEVVSRMVTRVWERQNIDMTFAQGVGEALKFGVTFLKQSGEVDRSIDHVTGKPTGRVTMGARLVMPWCMGVYRPDKASLDDQPCFVESTPIDMYEVWKRICNLPDAENLFKRIKAQAAKGAGTGIDNGTNRQVLSTSQLNTSPTAQTRPQTGGIINLGQGSLYSPNTPEVRADLAMLHELWVQSDEHEGWVTIQLIEPDIIIAPSRYMKLGNLFCKETHPYNMIQPNAQANNIWGRSELEDLLMIESNLDETINDLKRLMGLQYDKLLAFSGSDGIDDEKYDQFRTAGFLDMGQGGSVQDLTPKVPQEAFAYIEFLNKCFDDVSGFDNILSGKGESGVRSGVQTDTLARHASPRLRDRSLLVERQCAAAADTSLTYLVEKDGLVRWTDPNDQSTDFLLSQLPDDWRVSVDSHSSSPIYEENHQQLIAFGVKSGFIDGEAAIEMLPYPRKDILIEALKKKQAAQAQLIAEHPELLEKGQHKKK